MILACSWLPSLCLGHLLEKIQKDRNCVAGALKKMSSDFCNNICAELHQTEAEAEACDVTHRLPFKCRHV